MLARRKAARIQKRLQVRFRRRALRELLGIRARFRSTHREPGRRLRNNFKKRKRLHARSASGFHAPLSSALGSALVGLARGLQKPPVRPREPVAKLRVGMPTTGRILRRYRRESRKTARRIRKSRLPRSVLDGRASRRPSAPVGHLRKQSDRRGVNTLDANTRRGAARLEARGCVLNRTNELRLSLVRVPREVLPRRHRTD